MKNVKFRYFHLVLICLLLLILMAGCQSDDSSLSRDAFMLDDDDDYIPDDDDDGDNTDDDDSGTDDDDDDDDDSGEINIIKPEEGEEINSTVVDVQFEYQSNVSDIAVYLDDADVTSFINITTGSGWGAVNQVETGDHVLRVVGQTESKGLVSDKVNFSTILEGPRLVLELSTYAAAVGETVEATYTFYDEMLEDISDQVGPEYSVDNGAQIVGGSGILIQNTGDTNVTAEVIYKDTKYIDVKTVVGGDFDPPYIQINNPDRGEFVTSYSIYVTGRVTDPSPIDFLKVKSLKDPPTAWTEVSVDSNGNFSYMYVPEEGLNTIQFWAADEHGNEAFGNVSMLKGQVHPNGTILTDSMALRINQSGFDSIAQVAEDAINGIDFTTLLPPNPVVSGEFLLTTYNVDVNHNTLSIGPIAIGLSSPVSGTLAFSGSVGAIAMDVQIHGDLFELDGSKAVPYSITIPISASGASISGDLQLNIFGGDLYAELTNMSVTINNFYIGVFPDWLDFLNDIISDAIIDLFLEEYILDLIETEAAPLISDAINELNDALNQELDILGYAFNFTLGFESIDTVDNGVTLWSTVEIESVNPEGMPNQQPGSLQTWSQAPTMGQHVPGTTTPYGFGAVLDDDLLNQALFEAYESGLLSLRIDSTTAPDLGFSFNWRTSDTLLWLVLPELRQIHPDAPVAIQLRPQIMPVLVIASDGTLDTELESELQIGDFLIDVIVEDPQNGDVVAFTLALALYLPVTISVDTVNNTISVEFPQTLPVEIQVIFEEVDFNDSAFEDFIPMVLQFVVPILSSILDDFPIPSFSGYTLQVDALTASGSSSDWMGLFGSLTAASVK